MAYCMVILVSFDDRGITDLNGMDELTYRVMADGF